MNVLVTLKLPLPFEKATGGVTQPEGPVTAISVLPSPLKSPVNFIAQVAEDQLAKFPMNVLVTVKLSLPFEKATGKVFHNEEPVIAISAFPSPLKAPTNFLPCRSEAQLANWAMSMLVTLNLPSPFEKATGSVFQLELPGSAISVFTRPLKSPARFLTRESEAQPAKFPIGRLVTVKLPLPLEKATGSVLQPEGPVRAMSVLPSPL